MQLSSQIKSLLLSTVVVMGAASCSDDLQNENIAPVSSSETIDTPSEEWHRTTYAGSFVDAAHPTSGKVFSFNGRTPAILFRNVKIDQGPALEVWLSKNQDPDLSDPSSYISFGKVKGTPNSAGVIEGNFNYRLNERKEINYEEFKYVIIWCEAFSVNFGWAEIAPRTR